MFKGGTCLRKCYFRDYRFSEDLDFTFLDQRDRIQQELILNIIQIAEQVSGIQFYLHRFQEVKSKDVGKGYQVQIKYWGANHKPNQPPPPIPASRWHDKIELDFSYSEKLLMSPVNRPLFHFFPDQNLIAAGKIPCYALEEIASEKLRALIQRNRPRDCYDLWYLFNLSKGIDRGVVKELFYKKLEHKNISFSSSKELISSQKIENMVRHWKNSLFHQLPKDSMPAPKELMLELKHQISELLQ